jgi:Cu-Zn family superoxide dismutase
MTNRTKIIVGIAGWAGLLAVPLFWGCGGGSTPPPATSEAPGAHAAAPGAPGAKPTKHAVAKISTTSDGGITGQATFVTAGDNVDVALDVQHAPPGQRAWHIHQGTSCGRDKLADGGMGPPGSAAGPHWNPMKAPHGYPTAKIHHPGDFGNFTVDPSGKGTAKISTNAFNLDDTGEMSAIGHALIIHGGTDDGAGENGDAGPRVGCGIIEKQ